MVTIGEEQEQCLLGVHLQNISCSQSTEAETLPQTLMHFSPVSVTFLLITHNING